MHYRISQPVPTSQYIEIHLTFDCERESWVNLQLPAWRPGRYELANYAQFIQRISVNKEGNELTIKKVTKDSWTFYAPDTGRYCVAYSFYANRMDAGGCWSSPEQLYLNFSNFAFAVQGKTENPIGITLDLPLDYRVATALHTIGQFQFSAQNYQELVDSPLIASPNLTELRYNVGDTTFYIVFQGPIHFDTERLLHHFSMFSHRQTEAFHEFPASKFHFLIQLLPYEFYHGVEHKYSTVIALGPAKDLAQQEKMDSLMGVASHELYHFWNVCRIRPSTLLPYDLSCEVYFREGLVAEGVTSYFGDLYLLKSGYYSLEKMLQVIESRVNREFESQGWMNQSIVEASFDLWLDGYKVGIPDRKVSIYNRGALISLCLDIHLMMQGTSLEEAMRDMWVTFGKTNRGYSLEDFHFSLVQSGGDSEYLSEFFNDYVHGTKDLLDPLNHLMPKLGITVTRESDGDILLHSYGIALDQSKKVERIHLEAPAYHRLMIGEIVEKQEYGDGEVKLSITRHGTSRIETLLESPRRYFEKFKLQAPVEHNSLMRKWKE